ncbi:MAG: RagB/SusD family nutrient uptake outer membrane protein [Ginsengibacter sp.]
MKHIFRYILFGILLTGIVSCKKDWLDVTATNQIKAKDQFKQTSGYKDALMGVYIGMTKPSSYARDMTWNLVDILSQQYAIFPNLALYTDVQSYKYRSTRAMPQIDALWKGQYNTIANVNGILDEMEKNTDVLGKIDKAIIKGELLGLRAFLHFDLIRLYGESNYANRPELVNKLTIPYVITLSKDLTPQFSYKETFALLQKDISDALELLKEDPSYKEISRPAEYYMEVNREGFYDKREQRMNYYAVKALQARVNIWQGSTQDLQNAASAAEEVIAKSGAKLRIATSQVGNDKILSSEQLFSLNVTAFANIVGQFFNGENNTNYDALILLRPTAETLFETSNQNIGVPDIRFNTLLTLHSRGMVSQKLLQATGNQYRNIMPLMKLPEMYYIAAEAYLNTNLPKSIQYLNKVRESRGILQEIPADATLEVVKAELQKEYRKEFIAEGQLFFYYKRKGLTSFPGLSTQITANDQIYRLPYPDNEIEFGNRVQ